jgi:hypothetical protein
MDGTVLVVQDTQKSPKNNDKIIFFISNPTVLLALLQFLTGLIHNAVNLTRRFRGDNPELFYF